MTKDQKVHEAMIALRKHGLTVESIAKTSTELLEELIKPVGFYRRKAVYMRDTANILIEKHDGKVPNDLQALIELPGIGPKMAHITLCEAFDECQGIGVDSHMHRICNALGWVKSTKPEETRVQLESFLPKHEWGIVNHEIVGLGQMLQQPTYRIKLAKTLYLLKEDADFHDALALVTKLGFQTSALAKLDPVLQLEIETRASQSPRKKPRTAKADEREA
jgi:endonuclease III